MRGSILRGIGPNGRRFLTRRYTSGSMSALDGFKFDSNGLIPAIIQDHENGEVLMMAWMNRESLERTIESGFCTYWSRSRQQFWVKGETSGHLQHVKSISVDCDQDALLIKVEQVGAACHENFRSCFYRDVVQGELAENSERLD
jgi:phosphoribosyl-AMP cyclohydrolase